MITNTPSFPLTSRMLSELEKRNISSRDFLNTYHTGGGCWVDFYLNSHGLLASLTDEVIFFQKGYERATFDTEGLDRWYESEQGNESDEIVYL